MAGSIEELLDLLYTEIEEARTPLSATTDVSSSGTGFWT